MMRYLRHGVYSGNRKIFLVLLLPILSIYYVTRTGFDKIDIPQRRTTTKIIVDDEIGTDSLPIMHTFYEEGKGGEKDLLNVWEEEWSKSGFKTKVLTLKDTKRHPFYQEMKKHVEPLFKNGYNAICFYRWLAMASSGGGWMSDYDTLPTNFPRNQMKSLPNEGVFTSYEAHVPSLMSGSADEWTRVSKLLVDAIPRTEGLKSDMHVFLTLREEGDKGIVFEYPSFHIRRGFIYESSRKVDCKIMELGRAVHLSHHFSAKAFEAELFPVEITKSGQVNRNRARAAKIFMNDWREQCGGSKFNKKKTKK